jgi:hypothetical protein
MSVRWEHPTRDLRPAEAAGLILLGFLVVVMLVCVAVGVVIGVVLWP